MAKVTGEMMPANLLDQAIATVRPGIERLSADQFHRMIELGILREGQPLELIDGLLVRKDNSDAGGDPMTHGPKHAYCMQRLKALESQLKSGNCHFRQQLPITLSSNREPEPDIAIVHGKIQDYQDRHPAASDCLAAIEVADSSLDYDRTVKGPIYAAAAIPVYLLLNVLERKAELYQFPVAAEQRYSLRTDFQSGDAVRLDLANGLSLEFGVDEILP